MVAGRSLDDEGGVGAARIGVPFAAQGLHAFLEAAFAALVQATEQGVLEQMGQFLLGAGKVVVANAHHQPYRHVIALVTCLEYHLHAVGQQVAFDPVAVEGEARQAAEQQAEENQATHKGLPCGNRESLPKVNLN
ncbi:hypothetical protein D3C76_1160540 [compost metagenome]